MRGRGSCHSTFHRQVRLPVAAATAKCACHIYRPQLSAPATFTGHTKCACHIYRPQLNAPVTRTGHQYSKQVVRRLGAVHSIMDLKGGISWKIGKYKTALRKIKLAYFFYILSNLTCFLSFFKSCYDCVRLTKTCYSTYMLLLF